MADQGERVPAPVGTAGDRACGTAIPVRVRGLRPADWAAVARIYEQGLATGNASFEVYVPGWARFATTRIPYLLLVATDRRTDEVIGWAGATPVSSRRTYTGVVENSIYIAEQARGRGAGRVLLDSFIRLAEACGVWSIRAAVFPTNQGGLALHEACGFRRVGVLDRVGRRGGRWQDVVLMERRSPIPEGDPPLIRLAMPGAGAGGRSDHDAVRGLLNGAALPTGGLDTAWRVWVADRDGTNVDVAGTVAMERYEAAGRSPVYLLRSLAVAPGNRSRGLGSSLVRGALTCADLDAGTPATVALLTTTADGFFDPFGFRPVPRTALPASLQASAQLRGMCPDTARAYLRDYAAATQAGEGRPLL